METIQPVIMAGGAGTRLWPVSRRAHPKQFQNLLGRDSLFVETVRRVHGDMESIAFRPAHIIGGAAYEALIAQQMETAGIVPGTVVLEPFGRNTGAVAAMACSLAQTPSEMILLLPSDHHMADPMAFRHAVETAAPAARAGHLVTFGIEAMAPETGYGYIRRGPAITPGTYRIDAFVEKPDLATAEAYLADGRYAWNAGIFLFRADTMAAELRHHAPAVLEATEAAMAGGYRDGPTLRLEPNAFETCPSVSIDYAVMERTTRGAVHGPLACGWSDVGSWAAIADLAAPDPDRPVISVDTENCFFRVDEDMFVAALGVRDLLVIAKDGSVLILPRDRAQEVKTVVDALKAAGRGDLL